MAESQLSDRRPIPARKSGWARAIARSLAGAGVQPNHVSLFGFAITVVCAVLLLLSREADGALRVTLLLAAAGCIPIRAGCNMWDGMLAVELGRKTASGDIMNELPDRISDAMMLVAAGYAVPDIEWAPYAGWAAALAAVLTAYVRTLGAWAGAGSDFSGVMAKQQRMATIAVACVVSTFEGLAVEHGYTLTAALVIVAAGSVVTVAQRTAGIVRRLEQK